MKDIKFPFLIDNDGKPSITLLFAYFAFILAVGACVYLLTRDALSGTMGALVLFFGCLVTYRMRKLDKVKFDLDDKSFELDAENEEHK